MEKRLSNMILFGRFTLDNEDPVLYCYDLQLEECVSRKGLGKRDVNEMEVLLNFLQESS